jgi:Amt family ammonium transporter
MIYSFAVTLVIGFALHKTLGFRVSEEEEMTGVDSSEHAETGYDLGALGAGIRGMSFGGAPAKPVEVETNHDQEVTA